MRWINYNYARYPQTPCANAIQSSSQKKDTSHVDALSSFCASLLVSGVSNYLDDVFRPRWPLCVARVELHHFFQVGVGVSVDQLWLVGYDPLDSFGAGRRGKRTAIGHKRRFIDAADKRAEVETLGSDVDLRILGGHIRGQRS